MRKLLLLIFLVTNIAYVIKASDFDYKLRNFTIEEGLPSNTVYSVSIDSLGFAWICCGSEIARFDGYRFQKVAIPKQIQSINLKEAVWHNDHLYFTVDSEVWKFNPYEDKWLRVLLAPISGNISILSLNSNTFYYSIENYICQTNTSTSYRQFNASITSLKAISSKHVIASSADSIFLLNSHNLAPIYSQKVNQLRDIEIESDSTVLLASQDGLFRLNIYNHELQQVSQNNQITDLIIYNGKCWCATHSKGLINFDLQSPTNQNKIPLQWRVDRTDQIKSIHIDRNQLMWIGTKYNGVYLLSQEDRQFQHYHSGNISGFNAEHIIGFGQISDTTLLIFSQHHIYEWDKRYNQTEELALSLPNAQIKGAYHYNKHLYLYTNQGIFEYTNGNFHLLKQTKEMDINSIYFRKNGTGIITTNADEFIRIDTLFNVRSRIVPGKMRNSYDSANRLTSVVETNKGQIILGTENGLVFYNESTMSYVEFDWKELNSASVSTLFRDRENNIWIGTESSGLSLYNPNQNSFKLFGLEDGLIANSIYSINQDLDGNIWLGTNKGLYRFDMKQKRFTRYLTSDGIQGDRFVKNATFRLENGEMLFGGINGFNVFNPSKIGINNQKYSLVITNLKVNNVDTLLVGEELVLEHDQNDIHIEFSLLNYRQSGKNNYSVFLNNWDDQWINLENNNVLSYNNLLPGFYKLLIRGWNNDGFEGTPIQLNIRVMPAWWQTLWAKLIYVILTIGILSLIIRFLIQRIRLKNQLKIEQLERKQSEEMINFKLKFYTNISHEIRTPLTLISGPVEQLVKQFEDNHFVSQQIRTVKLNTDRLLRLVEQLLDFRKIESDKLPFTPTNHDVISFIKDVAVAFNDFAASKNINIELNFDCESWIIAFDPDKLEKILYNLISNAIKYATQDGKVRIKQTRENDRLRITIWDNGRGIESQHHERIFERFETENGIGIGLALTRELVYMHQGTITVDSGNGKGTSFIVEMPAFITKQELSSEERDEDEAPDFAAKILVVEDNIELNKFIASLFKQNYHIQIANNGQEALEMLEGFMPDIILSDVMMPQVSGIELCKIIRADIRYSHLPFVLLSAYSDIVHQMRGTEAGADLYIAKPFNSELLVQKVETLLSNRRRLREKYQLTDNRQSNELFSNQLDKGLVAKLSSIIDQNIDNPELNVELLANEISLSRSQLTRKLNSLIGLAPGQFIQNYRLKNAAKLLVQPELNIAEVAYQSGFSDPKYFSRNFKKLYGVTPSAYRESLKLDGTS